MSKRYVWKDKNWLDVYEWDTLYYKKPKNYISASWWVKKNWSCTETRVVKWIESDRKIWFNVWLAFLKHAEKKW